MLKSGTRTPMRALECPIRKSSRRLNRRSLANEDTLLKRFFSIFASSSPRLEIYSKVGNLQIALFLLRGNFRKSKQTLTRVNILNKSSVEAFNDVQICGTANESSFFWTSFGFGGLVSSFRYIFGRYTTFFILFSLYTICLVGF